MPHQSTFVITTIRASAGTEERTEIARAAAQEAGLAAAKLAEAMKPDGSTGPRPETISTGGNQHRFIQGEDRTNRILREAGIKTSEPFEFWSGTRGRTAEPGNGAPAEILENCWNSTWALTIMALESEFKTRPIFPQALIFPDETGGWRIFHHLGHPEEDVFGDSQPGGTAAQYLEKDPALAHHMAAYPLRELAKAQFRIEYIRALTQFPNRTVVELDWNM
jgi:hypothetical protein